MIAKTARRVAVALTISIGVGFLILVPWKNHVAEVFLKQIDERCMSARAISSTLSLS
jgi:hypothetical protein